jgi:hypothetical protein
MKTDPPPKTILASCYAGPQLVAENVRSWMDQSAPTRSATTQVSARTAARKESPDHQRSGLKV